jgi:hypothetical protein
VRTPACPSLASCYPSCTQASNLCAARTKSPLPRWEGGADTGLPIVGILLPFLHASIELVRCAHKVAFVRFAFLGWDIALTHDGPVLLETNSGWGALFHQVLDGPLGHTAFSRLVGRYA